MKPDEKKSKVAFRIIDRETGKHIGSYSRGCSDEYDFDSVSMARSANCHDMFQDKQKFAIAKYRVVYELIDPDCED